MKYQVEILEAFKYCGFNPRPGQAEYCEQVLTAYLDEGFKTVILNAPTGVGKSILGAVIAEVLEQKKGRDGLCSFMLMGQNVLAKQYLNTFVKDHKTGISDFEFLQGANNYRCDALSSNAMEEFTAESCALTIFKENDMTEEINKHCLNCEYQRVKAAKNTCRNLITNYSYYFVDRMFLANIGHGNAGMKQRTIAIFDEAQTINDLFVEHNAIYFSEKRLQNFHDEIAEHLPLGDTKIYKYIKKIKTDLVAGKITDENCEEYLQLLYAVYKVAADCAEKEAKASIHDIPRYNKMNSLNKKYFGLGCKIGDWIDYEYDTIFEFKPKEKEASIKAIFCGDMFKHLVNSEYMLFMSATITKDYLVETLGLNPDEVKFVQLAPTFPKESKKVIFYSPTSLNYKTLQDEKTISALQKKVATIIRKHSMLGERGIILTPSFSLTRQICESLDSEYSFEVLEHRQGQKLAEVIEDFKLYTKGPAVLVSPSMFEGISLDDDISRYQVFIKAPFASLGDKRIKFICDHYPKIYEFTTILKIIQGCGRSTRSEKDYSITYMLDSNLQRLWKSPQNIWTNEFEVCYNSII